MTPLECAKEKLSIPVLARLRGWAWDPGKSCRIPYQQDRSASGSVLPNERLFHDFTSGETIDAPALLARVESMTNEAACRLFIQLAGTAADVDCHQRANGAGARAPFEQPDHERQKPRLPLLEAPSREDLKRIAALRNVSLDAVALARGRGFLFVTRLNGLPCWALTDSSRWLCQLRRMDGELFARRDAPGFKAWTVTGSRGAWPIGCAESKRFASIAFVEGGGDFLAACHFIVRERRGREVAPVAMLGASNRIAADALPFFASKAVRIFAHVDKPNPKGARPGLEAAARWQEQLTRAGADVTCFDFSGLRQGDESPVCDLNDLTSVPPDDFESDRELSELMNF
jgi:hypothetical protein